MSKELSVTREQVDFVIYRLRRLIPPENAVECQLSESAVKIVAQLATDVTHCRDCVSFKTSDPIDDCEPMAECAHEDGCRWVMPDGSDYCINAKRKETKCL